MSEKVRPAPRRRSATESLLSIVLLLEALLVFFVTLVVYSLDVLSPGLAFGGGGAFFVLLLLVGRLLRYPWGIWPGWLLQAAIVATGFLVPLMFLIGAGFAALWAYCFVTGRRLDRRNASFFADADEASATPPPTDSPTDPKENQ